MKYAVGLTIYNPTIKSVEYILDLSQHFQLILYANSKVDKSLFCEGDRNVILLNDGCNNGLSVAYNSILAVCVSEGVDWLLLLDQDSFFDIKKLELMQVFIEKYDNNAEVGIHTFKTYPLGSSKKIHLTERYSEAESAISSGCFLNVRALIKQKIKWNEKIFLDHVDEDLCYLMRKKGLKIIVHNDVVLPQALGYLYRGHICHSPIRHYYLVRDIGYLYEDMNCDSIYRRVKYFIHELACILHEDNKILKIKYSLMGFFDGLKGVTGEKM